jgi:hypothetical protein
MGAVMRLLLLLSAFLAGFGGMMTGTATAAQRVESSASVGRETRNVSVRKIALPDAGETIALAPGWSLAHAPALAAVRPLFADRLRE